MKPTKQGEAPQEEATPSQVNQIDEGPIQAHLGEAVRSTVEETLNAMLDAEADRLCRAERYERTEAHQGTRAGSYQQQLHTKVGEVSLKVPNLRTLPEFYPEAMWQRCTVHFYRNVWTAVPPSKVKEAPPYQRLPRHRRHRKSCCLKKREFHDFSG